MTIKEALGEILRRDPNAFIAQVGEGVLRSAEFCYKHITAESGATKCTISKNGKALYVGSRKIATIICIESPHQG